LVGIIDLDYFINVSYLFFFFFKNWYEWLNPKLETNKNRSKTKKKNPEKKGKTEKINCKNKIKLVRWVLDYNPSEYGWWACPILLCYPQWNKQNKTINNYKDIYCEYDKN